MTIEKCKMCEEIATPYESPHPAGLRGLLRLKSGDVFHWECALKLRKKSNRSVFKKYITQQIEDIE